MSTDNNHISLVIFTCEGREHLLYNTVNSFNKASNYSFNKTILAIDGTISNEVIEFVNPDIVVQNPKRKGYVNNIIQALSQINTEYFFWLEDDWTFNEPIHLDTLVGELKQHDTWTQVVYSKFGPLTEDLKSEPLSINLYRSNNDFSANPCLCRTSLIKTAFAELVEAPKGDKLGEDGFENFVGNYFKKAGLICAIHDPVEHSVITHSGYLESTPRNWHMTNSLNQKTKKHLLTIPAPPLWRKLLMALKLLIILPQLMLKQLINNEAYELCFRILASIKYIKKGDR